MPRTMRGRLAILFALSTSIILAVSGALLYETLDRSIAQSLRHEMEATLDAAVSRLGTVDTIAELRDERPASSLLLQGHEDVDLAVFDENGNTLVSSPNFVPSPNVLTGTLSTLSAKPVAVQHGQRPLRYLVARASVAEKAAPLRVVVQRNYGGAQAFLHICALSVVLGVLVGTVLAALVAYRIAVFALKPLSQLAARADEISGNRLAHPLPDTGMADELRELTHAFNRMLRRLDD